MEVLFIILALLALIALVSPIVLIVWISKLQSRIQYLEQNHHSATARAPLAHRLMGTPPMSQTTHTPQIAINQSVAQAHPKLPTAPPEPNISSEPGFGEWIATDWPLKLGAFLLLISAGWFVSYAFMNNWIGPVGRISFGLVLGASLLVLGEWWHKKSADQSSVIYGLGASTILVTIFAARSLYEMFTPLSAMLFVVVVSIAIAASSIKHGLQSRAAVGLSAALIVPLLTNSPTENYFGLLLYLSAIAVGYVWLIWFKGWRTVLSLLLIGIVLYLVPLTTSYRVQNNPELSMLFLQFSLFFTLLLFTANLATFIKNRISDMWEILVAVTLGIFTFIWINQLVSPHLQGLASTAMSLCFVLGSYVSSRISSTRNPVLVYAAIGVSLLAGAISYQLSGPAMTIGYIVLTTAVVLVSTILIENKQEARTVGLLFIIPGFMALQSAEEYRWMNGVSLSDLAVLLIMITALLCTSTYLRQYVYTVSASAHRKWLASYEISALFMGMITCWLFTQAVAGETVGIAVSLIIFTIAGLGLYISGKLRTDTIVRNTGMTMLAFVTVRLLLVDVWNMPIAGRITTFALIGILFMLTTLFEKNITQQFRKKL